MPRKRSDFGNVLHEEFLASVITQKQLANESNVDPTVLSDMVTGERFAYDQTLFDDLYAIFESLSRLHVSITEDKVRRLLATIDKNHLSPARREELFARLKRELIIKQTYLTKQDLPLIGRERDIQTILSKLQDEEIRFLTLIGLPGVGKTELAEQIFQLTQTREYFTQVLPILYLDTAPTDINAISPRQTVSTSVDLLQLVTKQLSNRDTQQRTLLVLDNCEQITDIDNARGELLKFLVQNRHLTILATSRVRFSPNEYPVHSLKTPALGQENDETFETLQENDAVKLFLEGARRNQSSFDLNPQNASTIAELCRGLGGLPLALLIAGSWATRIHVKDLYAKFLTKDIQELPDDFPDNKRHSSLDKLIEVSYELLTDQEQTLFRRLGKLAGRCTLKASVAICGFDNLPASENEFLSILQKLSNHFLVTFENEYIDLAHITLRDYASRQLSQSPNAEYMKTYKRIVFYYENRRNAIVTGEKEAVEDFSTEIVNQLWVFNNNSVLKRIYIIYFKLQMEEKERDILWLIVDGLVENRKSNKYVIIYGYDPLTGIHHVNPQYDKYPKDTYGYQNLTKEEEKYYDNLLGQYMDLRNYLFFNGRDEEFMQWLSE